MPLQKEVKTKAIEDFHRHEKDTGSPEVQIAILTNRITQLILSSWFAQTSRFPPTFARVLAPKQLPELHQHHRSFAVTPQVKNSLPAGTQRRCVPAS
jgi:hypothetical protein